METKEINLEKLYSKQDYLLDDLERSLELYQENITPSEVVTYRFNSIEEFIGESILETADGMTGYFMNSEDPQVSIFVQCYSGGKQTWTYIKESRVQHVDYLISDKSLDTPLKRLEKLQECINKMREVQVAIEQLEGDE
ncbi:hypothetical protein KZ109_002719 [Enterococcus faecalis]|nr:hypothetical protein [Enterococcus faecalis]EGO5803052.1 hypothetical protein [Enterococcus faecalis]EGO5828126.1 hypothetical protein [Enterococcus faecalis]EGO6510950.1 hypothetical protein [Enterococcus faecalis]EHA4031878.1 hypothetical protein [Enterococcus faecalis]